MPTNPISQGYGYPPPPPSQYPQQVGGYNMPPPPPHPYGYYPMMPQYDQAKKQADEKQTENDVLDILHSVYDEPE